MSKDTVYKILSSENVSYTGSAANGAATVTYVKAVRIVSTTDCWVAIGTTAVATTASTLLPAFVAEYFEIGAGMRVSAIRSASDGTLNISYLGH